MVNTVEILGIPGSGKSTYSSFFAERSSSASLLSLNENTYLNKTNLIPNFYNPFFRYKFKSLSNLVFLRNLRGLKRSTSYFSCPKYSALDSLVIPRLAKLHYASELIDAYRFYLSAISHFTRHLPQDSLLVEDGGSLFRSSYLIDFSLAFPKPSISLENYINLIPVLPSHIIFLYVDPFTAYKRILKRHGSVVPYFLRDHSTHSKACTLLESIQSYLLSQVQSLFPPSNVITIDTTNLSFDSFSATKECNDLVDLIFSKYNYRPK